MEDAPVQIGASFRMPSIFLNEDQSKIEETVVDRRISQNQQHTQ